MNGVKRDSSTADELDILQCWYILAGRKGLIGLVTGGVFLLSIIISLLLPRVYSATASVMPPHPDSGPLPGSMYAAPAGLGGLAGGILGFQSATDTWVGVLKSLNVRDEIIKRFSLKGHYEAETMDGARRALDSRLTIVKSKESIISIGIEDRDPALAADIANAFVEELDRVNRSAVMNSGQRMRAFVEKRLTEAKAALSATEVALRQFQEENKAVKLDDQSKAIIEAIGSVKGRVMAKEVAMETLLSYATPENPQVQILRAELSGLKEKLKELEEGSAAKGGSVGSGGSGRGGNGNRNIFIPTDQIPDLSFQYVRLLRDAKVHEALYELLTQQYEMARIQEARDTPTIQVLDVAATPERPVKPRRALIVLGSTFLAFVFSVFLVFCLEKVKRLREAEGLRAD